MSVMLLLLFFVLGLMFHSRGSELLPGVYYYGYSGKFIKGSFRHGSSSAVPLCVRPFVRVSWAFPPRILFLPVVITSLPLGVCVAF